MKYNTFHNNNYPHTVTLLQWEPYEELDGLEYRRYDDGIDLKCRLGLNTVGSIVMFTPQMMPFLGLIRDFRDGSTSNVGVPFLEDTLYAVIKTSPLINPVGVVYGYQSQLSVPTAEQLGAPINPRPDSWLDQAI